jgi:outer membrane receptor protein involved in Fe transport
MAKFNNMDAPVLFKEDGIQSLILDNANAGIPDDFGTLVFDESQFTIHDGFDILTIEAALFGEAYFKFGKWTLTAGLRADYEGNNMDYSCDALIHYRLTPGMSTSYPLNTTYEGSIWNDYFQVLPKVSALYSAGNARFWGTISRGYKSGGFNTQIFSNILQSKMMYGLMEDLGVYFDDPDESSAKNTTYKPEKSWDFEVGGRWSGGSKATVLATASASAYYIACTDQQLTVFPSGNGTGRMMANAGHSESWGVEAEAGLEWKWLEADASYGFTHATFTDYDDGLADYSGNRIPYSPQSTLYLRLGCNLGIGRTGATFSAGASLRRIGKIWWDEANSLKQDPYWLAGADASVGKGRFTIFMRAENLTGTDYDVFYFKSVGNSFFQKGKPFRMTGGISIDF